MIHESDSIVESIKIFENLVQQDPEDTFSLKQLSKLYFRNSQPDQMISCYDKILNIEPDDTWTLKRFGEYSHLKKDYEKAMACFEKWVEVDPFDGEARTRHIRCFKDKTDLDEENKGKIFFNELKRYREKAESGGDSMASFESGMAYLTFTTGFTLTEEEIEAAKEMFNHGMSQDKSNLWCYWGMKEVFAKVSLTSSQQMYNEAIKICRKALEINPDSARGHYELGVAYSENYEANMKQGAIDEFRQAIAIEPEFIDAYSSLGRIYRMKKMLEEALKAFQMVLDIDPSSKYARDAIKTMVQIEKSQQEGTA